MEEKTYAEQRREALFHTKKNGWDRIPAELEPEIQAYGESYKTFLDRGKTERRVVEITVELAEAKGFRPFTRGMELKPGDKV